MVMAEEVEDKVASVMSQAQVGREDALKALDKTDGDVGRAVEFIKSSERNISIIKGRFSAPSAEYKGGFLVIIDAASKEIERIIVTVFRLNDEKFSADINEPWTAFQETLYSLKLSESEMFETAQKLHTFLERDILRNNLDLVIDAGRSGNRSHLNLLFGGWIKDIIYDESLSAETEVESIIHDDYRRREAERSKRTQPPPETEADTPRKAKKVTAALTAELIIDPTGGRPIGDLKAGDLVLTRITDGRDVARYIAQLIGGRRGDEIVPVAARIESINVGSSGRYTVTAKLGEGLVARMIGESKMKVRMAEPMMDRMVARRVNLLAALPAGNYGLFLTLFLVASIFVTLVIIFYLLWTSLNP